MATHFARGILTEGRLVSVRLSSLCHLEARKLPAHRQTRFLASRGLLAELMFMLYGTLELPEIIYQAKGKPAFHDKNLPSFSIAYAGNMVGVALTTEGECGLDMELQRATRGFISPHSTDVSTFSSNENLWISNQNDPDEARAQMITLRQSVLKLIGDVRNDDPRELQLLPGAGRLKCAHVAQIEAICDAEELLVWSIAVTPDIDKLQVWEFDSKQGWKSLPDIQTRANAPTGRLMRFAQLSAATSYAHN
ncbi:4'-phosphopantetheinyl transferase superfamily protein [Citrobacter amalonaticus]|uniref:4'-phosphopantetheinyl transferase family protein n=1 Tax=Citrobacter amalonaticus TaxID=35703 RepID=UPI00300D074E